MNDTTFLVLSDGTVYKGEGFGYQAPRPEELSFLPDSSKCRGEVVFNTGMTGYHEILTDPSYTGQIVTMTYPHIGNYGCSGDWGEIGPEEKGKPGIKTEGFVVRSLYTGPVPEGRITLEQFLKDNNTPGIQGVDTRALTLKTRDEGSYNGVIVRSEHTALTDDDMGLILEFLKKVPPMEGRNLIGDVGTNVKVIENKRGTYNIVLVDCGVKANIIRELTALNCKVTILPSDCDASDILSSKPDGVLYSNGPGDPAELSQQVAVIKQLIGKVPIFGICLGHQVISQALGARIFKMKFGHHGVNHPVRDEETKSVFVTSQNHGFAVDPDSMPDDVSIWFTNANDSTVEGLKHTSLPILSVQFHPEAAPGPYDSSWIIKKFLDSIPNAK